MQLALALPRTYPLQSWYVPTIHLTADDMDALRDGRLRLRCGQWIHIPGQSRRARWVGAFKYSGTLWAAHYPWDTFQALAEGIHYGGDEMEARVRGVFPTLKGAR